MCQRADISEYSLLGMFSYGAGIQHHNIGLVLVIGKITAHFAEHSAYFLAVRLILLAAICIDHSQGGVIP